MPRMERYLVGGAVRDELLGLAPGERDWVLVGATPEALTAQGYRQVGADFPVFLHPETGEEHALARTERKTAPGYRGFVVHAAPEVTLEEDLLRRDLTVNAMARSADGRLIDPFGGQRDLEARLLRHVSPAFIEDPVRVLRVARFAARFAPLGFRVADETLDLMRQMVVAGEVDALVPERVWAETERALACARPSPFFAVLRACGALARVFPELESLYGVPQSPEWHPEIDTGVHTMMVVDMAARLTTDPEVRFAALVHDLGKARTPADVLPKHHGHEHRGVPLVEALCERLRVPKGARTLAVAVSRFHLVCHRALELRASTALELLESLDGFRRPARVEQFLLACEADARGRLGREGEMYPQAAHLRVAHDAARAVDAGALAQGLTDGPEIQRRLTAARTAAIAMAWATTGSDHQ
jgi:tRNA nucleotidyltransferase (CCA-adding enzyme)